MNSQQQVQREAAKIQRSYEAQHTSKHASNCGEEVGKLPL